MPGAARAGPVPITDPALDCFSEFLPTTPGSAPATGCCTSGSPPVTSSRRTGGGRPGGVSWDNVALTVDPAAGPFLVTSRATAGTASGAENVTWDVAGTAGAALAPNVKISLSTDGGLTFPTVLAESTPNDGSQAVVLPSVTTTTARIKVEAVGNYFFDVNDAEFHDQPGAEQRHAPRGRGSGRHGRGEHAVHVGGKLQRRRLPPRRRRSTTATVAARTRSRSPGRRSTSSTRTRPLGPRR